VREVTGQVSRVTCACPLSLPAQPVHPCSAQHFRLFCDCTRSRTNERARVCVLWVVGDVCVCVVCVVGLCCLIHVAHGVSALQPFNDSHLWLSRAPTRSRLLHTRQSPFVVGKHKSWPWPRRYSPCTRRDQTTRSCIALHGPWQPAACSVAMHPYMARVALHPFALAAH
jgi:hypothetical protein